jgi:hypothetical protein
MPRESIQIQMDIDRSLSYSVSKYDENISQKESLDPIRIAIDSLDVIEMIKNKKRIDYIAQECVYDVIGLRHHSEYTGNPILWVISISDCENSVVQFAVNAETGTIYDDWPLLK